MASYLLIPSKFYWELYAIKNIDAHVLHQTFFYEFFNRKFLENKIDSVKFHLLRYLTKNQYLM